MKLGQKLYSTQLKKGGFTAVELAPTSAKNGDPVFLATYHLDTLFGDDAVMAINEVRGRIIASPPNQLVYAMGIDQEDYTSWTAGGASGSGVVDIEGKLVGILTGGANAHDTDLRVDPKWSKWVEKVLIDHGYDTSIMQTNPLFGIDVAVPISSFANLLPKQE